MERGSPRRYLDIVMPDDFILEVPDESDAGWVDHGRYQARLFDRLEDGTYVCAGHGGSPLFLRCVRQDGEVIEVLDGAGERFSYRLVAFPSDRYWATGGAPLDP